MSSELKKTLALLSCLSLAGCSHQTASESLLVEPGATSCTPLKALQLPEGVSLPGENKTYQIPSKPLSSHLVHSIDLQPPIQPLALFPDSEAYYQGKQAILQLEPSTDTRLLWQQLKQWLVQQNITCTAQDDFKNIIITDWIQPDPIDKTIQYSARYQLSLSPTAPAKLINELLSLGKIDDNKRVESRYQKKIPKPGEQRHYAIVMLNRLATDLTKQETAVEIADQVPSSPKK
jgi:outer membrane protein assembly factor BamC